MNQNKLFYSLNFINFSLSSSMSIIAPFYPPFAESQGLTSTQIGYIFAFHPIGGIIGSLYIGNKITNQNRFNWIFFSSIIQSIVMFIFIIQYIIQGYFLLLLTSIIARFINGFAYSILITAFYSYIPNLFPYQVDQKIATAEMASSVGFVVGPVLGSILYSIGGYIMPFICQILLSLICGLYCYLTYYSQQHIIEDIELETLIEKQEQKQQKNMISYREAFSIYQFSINSLIIILTCTMITYGFPILSIYLINQFNIDANKVGYYDSIFPCSYAISQVIMTFVESPNKKLIIFIASIIHSLVQFFYGPDSQFTGFDNNLMIFCISQSIGGIFSAMTIYTLPLMIESLNEYNDDSANCIATAVFSTCIFCGEIFGPLISGVLNQYLLYERIASIFGIFGLIISIIYIIK